MQAKPTLAEQAAKIIKYTPRYLCCLPLLLLFTYCSFPDFEQVHEVKRITSPDGVLDVVVVEYSYYGNLPSYRAMYLTYQNENYQRYPAFFGQKEFPTHYPGSKTDIVWTPDRNLKILFDHIEGGIFRNDQIDEHAVQIKLESPEKSRFGRNLPLSPQTAVPAA